MAWHDDYPKYVIENDEPVEAQVGDEPTHVLMPIHTIDTHEAFYRVAIAERNYFKRGAGVGATPLNMVQAALGIKETPG